MIRLHCTAAALLVALGGAASLSPDTAMARIEVPRQAIDPGQPRIRDPYRVVDTFLQAVDRGELVVFGRTLSREMVLPTRIEYSYDLAGRSTDIRIHADLREPIVLSGGAGHRVRCISAAMKDGHIVEVESHVWLDE